MSLFATNLIGMEITRSTLSAAVLLKQPGLPVLMNSAVCRLAPETLQISHREPNVRISGLFVEQVQQLRHQLQTKEIRVALSLPDAAGRVLLLDLEAGWNSRDDALEMIRWKLKKSAALESADLQVDFQPLAGPDKDDGRCPVLVATIARPIVEQYEQLLHEAGLQPAWIDFTGLSLARAYEQGIGNAPVVVLVFWQGGTLGTIFFHEGEPVFYRTKQIPPEQADNVRVAMECTYSVLAYRQQYPGSNFTKILYISQDPADTALRSLLAGCFEQSLQLIEPNALCAYRSASLPDGVPLNALTGAIAAAVGRLPCV